MQPPPLPLDTDSGTEPQDEDGFVSETVATLEGATETGFNPPGTPFTFRLSCPNLAMAPDTVIVWLTEQLSAAAVTTTEADFDLVLTTSGEGQQSISRTFEVEAGYRSVTVRFRFITSEVPGGWFGSQFNDFYNVAIRALNGGGSIVQGNSMNGLGLAAFDGGGATGWYQAELPIGADGDTVQVDVAVANVADGLFDSQVVVDIVKKKTLTISQLQLNDIDNAALRYLSASAHTYFSGNTRVHGTITIAGPEEDTLAELTLEVYEGGRIAVGTLPSVLAGTLLVPFGTDGQVRVSATQLLFEVPGAQLAAANQSVNGQLTLRARARSSSGETAERDFGPVTKLVRFTGTNRFTLRDEDVGGDDWAKPTVRVLVSGTSHAWGDFSNMNGGPFPPHNSHTRPATARTAGSWTATREMPRRQRPSSATSTRTAAGSRPST